MILTTPKYAVGSWPLPNGTGMRRTMIMITLRGMLMGAAFPVTGFSEMPKAGFISQQQAQQQAQQLVQRALQQPAQQTPQQQLSGMSIPLELIPRLHNISRDQMIRAMQARSGAAGGNLGGLAGAMFQPGTVNGVAQQLPPGLSLEMMQAFMQRKQDGGG